MSSAGDLCLGDFLPVEKDMNTCKPDVVFCSAMLRWLCCVLHQVTSRRPFQPEFFYDSGIFYTKNKSIPLWVLRREI